MSAGREGVLASERRWSLPVALMTLAGVGLLVGSVIVLSSITGDGDAEILRAAHEHSSEVTLSSALQALAFVLFAAPLVYLFRAAQARSSQVRGQLIGLVVAAPLFLAGASVLNAVATDEAASDFVAGKATADLTRKQATTDCRAERKDDPAAFEEDFGGAADGGGPKGGAATGGGPKSGAAAGGGGSGGAADASQKAVDRCAATAIADDKAQNAVRDASTNAVATGLGLGGRLGLAFAFIYSCLWGMRTGLLTRFWGSLGMALGVAALLLLIQFTLIWFLYFALLVAGWVPGGRPPAWAAGEAIPWPSPGEKAAGELTRGDGEAGGDPAAPEPSAGGSDGPRRKRKQRD